MSLKDIKDPSYFKLNNQINIPVNGQIPLGKDKEAIQAFLSENVEPNRLFTYSYNNSEDKDILVSNEIKNATFKKGDKISFYEKLTWLVQNDYYEYEFLSLYTPDFIRELRHKLQTHNFKFLSFMAIYKFYKQYAMKTNDSKYYLEDFEDRALANALYMGNGDEELAKNLARSIIERRYVPATPTLSNTGRKRRGEFASCFPAGTKISTISGEKDIIDVKKGDLVLTHDGTYKNITEVMTNTTDELIEITVDSQLKAIRSTPEHPYLVRKNKYTTEHEIKELHDGITEDTVWIAAKDIKPGEMVVTVIDHQSKFQGYKFVTVVKTKIITLNKTELVYNMDVEDNHTYVANNMLVHNCFIIQVQDSMPDIGRSITNALQLSTK